MPDAQMGERARLVSEPIHESIHPEQWTETERERCWFEQNLREKLVAFAKQEIERDREQRGEIAAAGLRALLKSKDAALQAAEEDLKDAKAAAALFDADSRSWCERARAAEERERKLRGFAKHTKKCDVIAVRCRHPGPDFVCTPAGCTCGLSEILEAGK